MNGIPNVEVFHLLILSDMYVQLNQCSELSWCQRPIDEQCDSFDNKRKKDISERNIDY